MSEEIILFNAHVVSPKCISQYSSFSINHVPSHCDVINLPVHRPCRSSLPPHPQPSGPDPGRLHRSWWAGSARNTRQLSGCPCSSPCLRHQRGRNDVTYYLVALRHGDEKLLDSYSNYVLTLHFNWNHTYQINYFSIRITAIRHIESDGVSNNRRLDCLLNRLLRHISKKTPKLNFTGFC